MELIRINGQKVKVMLTSSDMVSLEIDCNRFFENGEETKRAFKIILSEIRKRINFTADDKEISVQYFPSREGGCEMFISDLRSEEAPTRTPVKAKRTLPAKYTKKEAALFRRESAFRFADLTALLQACSRLCTSERVESGSAFLDERGNYHLFLRFYADSPFGSIGELGFLFEYGRPENVKQTLLFVTEHGTSICAENAVHILGQLG